MNFWSASPFYALCGVKCRDLLNACVSIRIDSLCTFKVSLDYLFLGWCLCVVLYSYSRLIDYCLIRFSLVLTLEVCSSIGVDWHALDYALV